MGVDEGTLPTEDAPKDTGWIASKLTQIWVRIDGLLHRVMGMQDTLAAERGPDPDYPGREDLRDLLVQATREGARRATIDIGTYQEGGGGWNRWAMPGLVTLAVAGIVGNVVQAMSLSALKQEVQDMSLRIDKLEKLVEPRYRGSP